MINKYENIITLHSYCATSKLPEALPPEHLNDHRSRCFVCYTTHMFNKAFYKFLFSFVGVVATVLLIILVIGVLGLE
jgi:hypothetical protein